MQLTVVLKLVHTAVNNSVVDALVGLNVHYLCQVISAGRGKEPAHLHGEFAELGSLADFLGNFGKAFFLKLVGVVRKVINR